RGRAGVAPRPRPRRSDGPSLAARAASGRAGRTAHALDVPAGPGRVPRGGDRPARQTGRALRRIRPRAPAGAGVPPVRPRHPYFGGRPLTGPRPSWPRVTPPAVAGPPAAPAQAPAPKSDLGDNAALKYWQAFGQLPPLDKDQEKLLQDWRTA